MANDRLRAAITQAGLDVDELARRADVDTKTVRRWLSGRTPYGRHRARVAQILGRTEHELWPEVAIPAEPPDARREILGAYAHANDLAAPDWRALLRQAGECIELLGDSLSDILTAPGAIDAIAAKATGGCEVRILIAAPDSIFVRLAAGQLGQEEDEHGITPLEREIELVRGHLEPLLGQPNLQLRRFLADRFNSILRFDDQMLVTLDLWGAPAGRAPLLHLRRDSDDGLFDQFTDHFDSIWQNASEPEHPNPASYPNPAHHPDRYTPAVSPPSERPPITPPTPAS